MKQILQNLGSGETLLAEVPAPGVRAGSLLIRTEASLVSLGTEKMLVDFGRANFIQKARKQPDKVRQVLQKIRTDGLFPTIAAVRNKLDQPLPLGYCNVGRVLAVGAGVSGFAVGDRVVSNGPHAEIVCVPKNLCAKVPEGVPAEEAAFTVVGSIGLQGIRLIRPTLGETVVVTGLGLIGLLAVQALLAAGCDVIGVDFDSRKCGLARSFGAKAVDLSKGEDPVAFVNAETRNRGADAVLITASTRSDEPMHQAAQMCRQRGRVVLVGVVGLNLMRSDFYEKEISFQVSCSYGPGRYDADYEERGNDYPFGLVRWTEGRNFEAILGLMKSGKMNAAPLISHRYPFDEALSAYANLGAPGALGIVMHYPETADATRTVRLSAPEAAGSAKTERGVVGVLGAGNFTGATLLPALKKTDARLKAIVSASGVTGTHLAKKYGVEISTTDGSALWNDAEIDTVFITTRHNAHAAQAIRALDAGKNVYVEKPLCLTPEELNAVRAAMERNRARGDGSRLMVGFNRRFSPHVREIKKRLDSVPETKAFVMTVNAGAIPANHWTQDTAVGGGRLLGEACHFVDLLRFLAGTPIAESRVDYLGGSAGALKDVFSISLKFADGSIGTIHYFANGEKSFPKERLEIFCGEKIIQLDNFRVTRGFGWKGFSKFKTPTQDKGHAAAMRAMIEAVRGGAPSPIPEEELWEVCRVCLDLARG
ncbi:bi-domain-containing oxidoreductase [Candidatus Spyradosoma sp. SGI.093]|uniref:bi-domain-containing oxidoreductase n=1 Tax=Candidatus Spyradosoma sp. SGI.093 TaxID=3420583 RepID=UPI003CFD23DE